MKLCKSTRKGGAGGGDCKLVKGAKMQYPATTVLWAVIKHECIESEIKPGGTTFLIKDQY
jgi:hypothetical protein